MVGILHVLSQVLGALAVGLLPPAGIALALHELDYADGYVAAAGLAAFAAGACYFGVKGRDGRLNRAQGFVLIVAVWAIPPIFAAIPLMEPGGVTYGSALFDAVSSYTSTGAVALADLSTAGRSEIFYRAELQWLGGLMTLLTIVSVLAASGLGGVPDVNMALVSGAEDGLGRMRSAVRRIATAYIAITLCCAVLLLATGMPPFDGICLALATVSTGGFMPIAGDLSTYGNSAAEVVIMLFMVIGATSILWHRMLVEGRWTLLRRHRESYWVIGVAAVVGLGYAFALSRTARGGFALPDAEALRDGLFAGVSLVSTTGFESRPGALQALPATIILVIAIIGGGAISTAGGLKYYRLGGMLVQSLNELRRLFYPNSVRSTRFGSVPYDMDLMKAIWSNLAVMTLAIGLAALLMAASMPSFAGALTVAVSAFSNIGPLYSNAWPGGADWPSYSEFGLFPQIVLIVTMILGRIEVLALLAALNLTYWHS